MTKIIKLTKAEKEVLARFQRDVGGVLRGLQGLVNDLIHYKVEEIGREKGIDFTDGNWSFDAEALEFRKIEPIQEPAPSIPKKKGSKKSRAKKIDSKKETT